MDRWVSRSRPSGPVRGARPVWPVPPPRQQTEVAHRDVVEPGDGEQVDDDPGQPRGDQPAAEPRDQQDDGTGGDLDDRPGCADLVTSPDMAIPF
ncbi:hypothetical protein AOZ06_23420 [Kibdelosporangium phytohabitans]|uniref:Uncharacterized protein n=1 Tax=Kibdelosporangium phytohabitans TaxID=860235 RepID=A0A0N9I515_9PSEU|nr:hypothetical protein AOZ06_23420 [Kibdelosporangium phytohabitans]